MVDLAEPVMTVAEASATVATRVVADERGDDAADPREAHDADYETDPFRVRGCERQRSDHGRAQSTYVFGQSRQRHARPCILHPVPTANINIRLQPRAKRNAIVDEREGVLRVSVAAAPVDGLANAALCKLIAKRAGVARGRVSVIRGERSRDKTVRVEGVTSAELRRTLGLATD